MKGLAIVGELFRPAKLKKTLNPSVARAGVFFWEGHALRSLHSHDGFSFARADPFAVRVFADANAVHHLHGARRFAGMDEFIICAARDAMPLAPLFD